MGQQSLSARLGQKLAVLRVHTVVSRVFHWPLPLAPVVVVPRQPIQLQLFNFLLKAVCQKSFLCFLKEGYVSAGTSRPVNGSSVCCYTQGWNLRCVSTQRSADIDIDVSMQRWNPSWTGRDLPVYQPKVRPGRTVHTSETVSGDVPARSFRHPTSLIRGIC